MKTLRKEDFALKLKSITNRAFLILFVFIMAFSNTATANAAIKSDNTVSPCFKYINNTSICLSISGIEATCTASVMSSVPVKLSIKMELQKKKSSGYTTVETWTVSDTDRFLAISESRLINIFCDYRLKATYTAGSETHVDYKY